MRWLKKNNGKMNGDKIVAIILLIMLLSLLMWLFADGHILFVFSKDLELGSVADFFGATLSGIAIIMVVWQTNKTKINERELLIYSNNVNNLMEAKRIVNNLIGVLTKETGGIEDVESSNRYDRLFMINNIVDQLDEQVLVIRIEVEKMSEVKNEIENLRELLLTCQIGEIEGHQVREKTSEEYIIILFKCIGSLSKINLMLEEVQKDIA